MFKILLKILIFIYLVVFIFYFSIQIISDDNYVLNENNYNDNVGLLIDENNENISSDQPWLTNKVDHSDIEESNEKMNNDVGANIVRLDVKDKIFIDNIPFTTQSPFANWENSMQQDGCEEASSIMAMKWVQNENLEKEDALNYILNISEYIEEKYGEYRDISVYDIKNWIFNDYFKYENVEVLENVTKETIINKLNNNNILLIPTNGRLLENPNFVSPGPKTHMVVILGYDIEKNIFIVNDPGTRLGENYEYNMDILYNAIYSYPTGYHEDVDFVEKNIIVVWK
ncbi:hypothetical protein EOM09_03170 [bacterium]|nr:hypothetical protein [bacterium]